MEIAVLDRKSIGESLDYTSLEKLGTVTYYDYTTESQCVDHLKDVVVAVSNKIIYTKELMMQLPKLKLICMTGTGYNNIDVVSAKELGIAVCNVVDYCTDSVVQHTFAMVFHLINQLSYYEDYTKSGRYIGDESFSHFEVSFNEIKGMQWGIVGLGNIGKEVARLATAFGADVVYYSTSGKNTNKDYKQVDYDTLIESSDIVTIHAPLNTKTEGLFDERVFERMKKTAIIVNVGRGGIIKESAVALAINSKMVGGIGLDVFTTEPMSDQSPLLSVLDNRRLLLTPHVAWGSIEARQKVIEEVAMNITSFSEERLRNRVD